MMSFSEVLLLAICVAQSFSSIYLWTAPLEGQEEIFPTDRIMSRGSCVIVLIFFVSFSVYL